MVLPTPYPFRPTLQVIPEFIVKSHDANLLTKDITGAHFETNLAKILLVLSGSHLLSVNAFTVD